MTKQNPYLIAFAVMAFICLVLSVWIISLSGSGGDSGCVTYGATAHMEC